MVKIKSLIGMTQDLVPALIMLFLQLLHIDESMMP